MTAKWEQTGAMGSTNYILRGNGFYISYNPDLNASVFGAFFGSDNDGPETAIVENGRFHILNGDYRPQYEKLVPQGLDACMRFYAQQSAHADSTWSTKEREAS